MKYLIILILVGLTLAQKPSLLNLNFAPFNSSPYLTPASAPTNSINVNWNTEKLKSTIVAYGLTSLLEDTIEINGVRNYHHVRLNNLSPATEYFYKILPDGNIKRFKTFPAHIDSFTFITFGDTRSDSAMHQSIINRMAQFGCNLIIHSGDLVMDGSNSVDWQTFFNIEDTLLQNIHFLPTIGNHEKPYYTYDTLFALPGAEYFYSANYGNAHFIMLNTQMDLSGPQQNWLINDLKDARADTTTAWIFVNLHRPPYSSGNHGSEMDVRNAWCLIFEEYGVDIVFAGHDHCYERTEKINGVIYIVTGGGGAPLYDVGKSSWTAYSAKAYHFCLINIIGKKLNLKTITPENIVIDSLLLTK